MPRLVVVAGDPVKGTDTHQVTGFTASGSDYAGNGKYAYAGAMTDDLSGLVRIDGKAVALTTSASSLDPEEDAIGGGHHAASGEAFTPATPKPAPKTLKIVDTIGPGTPGDNAGSAFVAVNSTPVLLDGDPVDTCGSNKGDGNSTVTVTVTAGARRFVAVSE